MLVINWSLIQTLESNERSPLQIAAYHLSNHKVVCAFEKGKFDLRWSIRIQSSIFDPKKQTMPCIFLIEVEMLSQFQEKLNIEG